MKKYITILLLFLNTLSPAQNICLTNDDPVWVVERARLVGNLKKTELRSPSDFKVVRINYHFVLRNNGTGNFTETGDNRGNALNGYQFAKDITNAMNQSLSYNIPMNIPPNNSVSVNTKNYAYVIDAIYFHRDDAWFNFGNGQDLYNTVGADKNSVMNIILTHRGHTRVPPSTISAGGYASSLSHAATAEKFTENRDYYQRYIDFLDQLTIGDQYGWAIHATYKNTVHELGHLLGLSHTVNWNDAPNCPTVADDGFVNVNCDDGCADTPTAWYIRDVLQAPIHPGCGWGTSSFMWCSNNMMDYNDNIALTPCQLGIIHAGLDGGLKNYKTCIAVKTDNSLCDIGYPKLSYFGKIVTIGCSGTTATLTGEEEAKVFFSDQVVLNPATIDGAFEVVFQSTCN
jgi:hypothetical protein